MAFFREHHGLLDESMAAVQVFETKEELITHLNGKDIVPLVTTENIEIKPYGFDKRIQWATYIVTLAGYGVLGFTDGPL